MKTKILILVTLCIVAFSAFVYAQTTANKPNRPLGKKECKMGECKKGPFAELNLSDQQKAQIKDIMTKMGGDIKVVMSSNATNEEKKTQIQAIKKSAYDSVMAILTPEQVQKANQMNLYERFMSGKRMHAMGMLAKQLELSDQQKSQLASIMSDFHAQLKALKNDTSLDKKAKFAKMKELKTGLDAKIKSILAPEQYQKYQDIKSKIKDIKKDKGQKTCPKGNQ